MKRKSLSFWAQEAADARFDSSHARTLETQVIWYLIRRIFFIDNKIYHVLVRQVELFWADLPWGDVFLPLILTSRLSPVPEKQATHNFTHAHVIFEGPYQVKV